MGDAQWYEDDTFWRDMAPTMFHEARWAAAVGEVDAVLKLSGAPAGAAVLDMCCGPGRHSLELARRGFRVTGVDRTAAYLDEAGRRAAAEGLAVEWVRADMHGFTRPAGFGLALSLFTSFGYAADAADDARMMRNLHDALRPGGRLVLEMASKEVLARGFREREWHRVGEILLLEERAVVGPWEAVRATWTRIDPDGRRRQHTLYTRMYSGVEMTRLLKDAGYTSVEIFGSLEGAPYDQNAKRLVAVATKGNGAS